MIVSIYQKKCTIWKKGFEIIKFNYEVMCLHVRHVSEENPIRL